MLPSAACGCTAGSLAPAVSLPQKRGLGRKFLADLPPSQDRSVRLRVDLANGFADNVHLYGLADRAGIYPFSD